MSEMAEVFNAWNKLKQEKRADNREQSTAMLTAVGIQFESKNAGAHLIVTASHLTIDFWPGTGLWQVRGYSSRKRGVRNLIKFCKEVNK
jgi:hypothetical protein